MLKKTDSGNPADWWRFAGADLDAVRLLVRHRVSFGVCRSKLAEALEKLLKGDLLGRGWPLEKTHDLQRLCDGLAEFDEKQAASLQSTVDDLAEAYTEDRYPGFDLDAEEDWDDLLRLFEQVEAYGRELRSESETASSGNDKPEGNRTESGGCSGSGQTR